MPYHIHKVEKKRGMRSVNRFQSPLRPSDPDVPLWQEKPLDLVGWWQMPSTLLGKLTREGNEKGAGLIQCLGDFLLHMTHERPQNIFI